VPALGEVVENGSLVPQMGAALLDFAILRV